MGRPRKNHTADGEALRNSGDVDGAQLREYIERIETCNEAIADCQSVRRELYTELKSAGYDVATVRAIVKRRAMDWEKRLEAEKLLEMYLDALGDFASTPLGEAAADRLREAV